MRTVSKRFGWVNNSFAVIRFCSAYSPQKFQELIASLESVQSLRDSLQLPITQDAKEVVEDSLYDQLGVMEHTYLLAPRNAVLGESLHKVGELCL